MKIPGRNTFTGFFQGKERCICKKMSLMVDKHKEEFSLIFLNDNRSVHNY